MGKAVRPNRCEHCSFACPFFQPWFLGLITGSKAKMQPEKSLLFVYLVVLVSLSTEGSEIVLLWSGIASL